MSNGKPSYTEVLEMIKNEVKEINKKMGSLDAKLDTLSERTVVLETKQENNKSWHAWLLAIAVTAINIIGRFM